MREFTDVDGRVWIATTAEDSGFDYKGRLYLVLRSADGVGDETLELRDVRWNSDKTARRTIATMSLWELRRRLRIARGRSAA